MSGRAGAAPPDVRPLPRSGVAAVLAFVVILVGAAVLRFWGIGLGLPNTGTRPDERELLSFTAAFPSGDLNPRWFIYPPLYFHVVWLWTEGVLAVRRLFVATPDYATLLRDDMAAVILYGRWLGALAGTATVALAYRVGRRLGGTGLGLLAAFLLAVDFLHVRDSHALKDDVPLALGVLATVALLARWMEAPSRARALAAGVAIGVSTGLKYTGILLLVPAWIAGVLVSPATGFRRFVPRADVVLCGAVAIATFLATSPHLVLDYPRLFATGRAATSNIYEVHNAPRRRPVGLVARVAEVASARAFAYHVRMSLRRGTGLAFAVATPIAVAAALVRRPHPFLTLAAAYAVVHYVAIGASPVHLARYLTPIVPLLALLVAWLVLELARRATRPALRAAIVAGLAIVLAAEPLASSIAHDRIAARTDTRVLATRWMAEQLPPGSVVAMLGSTFFPIADPDVPPGIVRPAIPLGETHLERWGVTHVLVHEHWLDFSHPILGQLRALAPHLRLLVELSPYTDGPAGIYEREDAYYIPFGEFRGVVRPGPLIRIYAYAPEAS